MATKVLIASLASLIPTFLAAAQNEGISTNPALQRLQTQPQVSVSVNQRNRSVTAALDIRVRVTNLTDSDIYLRDIKVVLPGDLSAARAGKATESIQVVRQLLNPGQQKTVLFYLSSHSLSLWSLVNYNLLTFPSGIHEGYVLVTYRVPPDRYTDVLEPYSLPLEASLFSLLGGGILGALLLAVFRVTGRWRRESDFDVKLSLKDGVLLWVSGSVTSIIVVLIIQRVEDFPLPVNFAINDFFGGIVVGLLSYHLGIRLASWLLKDPDILKEYGK